MSASFHELLEATIEHLQALRARGTQFLPVESETWRTLQGGLNRANAPAPQTAAPSRKVAPVSEVPEPRVQAATPIVRHEPAALASDTAAKIHAMTELRDRALECIKCPDLAATCRNVVFGVGSIDAELMFVGGAPGPDEDAAGEPFGGAAGQTLTKMIQAMGLSREQVYITNIVKCRSDLSSGGSGHRKPTPDEIGNWIPYLHAQVNLIKPKVLVVLGDTAMEALLGKSGITERRGQWETYCDTPVMPTFHPEYLLSTQSNREKRKVWEDLLAVMEKLELPISEKQRGFFLKP